tara:strand:+ start:545 stop:751 length:207 start_codon:yes stop_codon:yes gene_type:complete
MNCNLIIKKYKDLLNKTKNTELEIKVNNDSPLVKSYYISRYKIENKELLDFKKNNINLFNICSIENNF